MQVARIIRWQGLRRRDDIVGAPYLRRDGAIQPQVQPTRATRPHEGGVAVKAFHIAVVVVIMVDVP